MLACEPEDLVMCEFRRTQKEFLMGNRTAMHYVRGLFYFIHTHKLNSVKKAGPLLFLFALRAAKNPSQTTCKYSEFVVK